MQVQKVRNTSLFIREHSGRQCLLKDMGFVFSEHERRWTLFMEVLREFLAREGHCRVPRGHMEGSYALGLAVSKVRSSSTFIRKRDDRIEELRSMGFVFNEYDKRWMDFLQALRTFRMREGHLHVPRLHKENAYPLGKAVLRVRHGGHLIRGRADRLSTLRAMGFAFSMSDKRWEMFLTALHSFKRREGHCCVPWRHREGSYNLGIAVNGVRSRGYFVSGHPERREELDQLGFVWRVDDAQWSHFLEALWAFASREGHCLVPQRHVEKGYALGRALSSMRNSGMYIHERPERARVLEAMGVTFQKRNDVQWRSFYEALQAFQAREGHCCVPARHLEGTFRLGPAVMRVRHRGYFVKGRPDRHRVLEDMGFRLGTGRSE
eukprot:UN1033